ncbi:hypothetical protein CspHIS471_0313970 [Cutaneotrichosporon sp. HIS471]|nr:hypothetical protein CspHIS471_0313970 [Cutaneotrichosporon sp. HIS471]
MLPGSGTAQVLMVNNGFLSRGTHADWYATTSETTVTPPVMCFVIRKDGRNYLWDLGMRSDLHNVGRTWSTQPDVRLSLPRDLPPELAPAAVYLSHYHWDHSGDPLTVPPDVPIYVGRGTLQALKAGFDEYVGDQSTECVARLSEMPEGSLQITNFPFKGHDVFDDGSFVILPAPGHCPGHSVAVVRTTTGPDTYMVLGGDSGHHRSLYEPCPYHARVSTFGRRKLHGDPKASLDHLSRLTGLHARDDTWVVLAHEEEVMAAGVPERQWLNDWKERGWKDKAAAVRADQVAKGCWVAGTNGA